MYRVNVKYGVETNKNNVGFLIQTMLYFFGEVISFINIITYKQNNDRNYYCVLMKN